MTLSFDAVPPPAHSSTAVNPAKLRDEIHRLSQRLVRARESYNQDFIMGDPEVPLDEQLAVIESYSAKLEIVTEQLRQHDAGTLPTAGVPEQPSSIRAQTLAQTEVRRGRAAPRHQPRSPAAPGPAPAAGDASPRPAPVSRTRTAPRSSATAAPSCGPRTPPWASTSGTRLTSVG